MQKRIIGAISIGAAALWPILWEFVRSLFYERGSRMLAPFIDSITIDQIFHWGPTVGLLFLGLWLFWKTSPRRSCRSAIISNTKQERIFVPSNVTPERLLIFFEENTAINAAEPTKRYIGQWMPVTGTLRNVSASGQVSFERSTTPLTWFDYAEILCYFRKEKIGDLKILKRGDKITVVGQISRIRKLDLELDNCELVDP